MSKTRPPTPSQLRRRWARGDAEERRGLIVDAAMTLLEREGPAAVTVRRVAQRLGVGAMTLYTYVEGQQGMRLLMVRRGFEMLHNYCQSCSSMGARRPWWGGSRAYVTFAVENPRLYEIMFTSRVSDGAGEDEYPVYDEGFQPLLERVSAYLSEQGVPTERLAEEADRQATLFWIALHGLASLAIANRLKRRVEDVDELLQDLLDRVAPEAR